MTAIAILLFFGAGQTLLGFYLRCKDTHIFNNATKKEKKFSNAAKKRFQGENPKGFYYLCLVEPKPFGVRAGRTSLERR